MKKLTSFLSTVFSVAAAVVVIPLLMIGGAFLEALPWVLLTGFLAMLNSCMNGTATQPSEMPTHEEQPWKLET